MAAQLRIAAVRLAALALATVGGLLAARPAAAEGRPRYGGDATGTLLGRPGTLDPALSRSHAEVTLVGLVFDTLYRLDAAGRPVPHLAAAAPEPLGDGTAVRVAVLAGVGFHDGRPLGPADVAASLERARRTSGLLAVVAAIAVEEGAVVVTSTRRCPEPAALLAAPATAITPGGKAPDGQPVGSGPFVVTAVDERTREIRLVANPNHFAGRPYLDALWLRWYDSVDGEARAYEAGVLDLSLRGAVAFAGHQPKRFTEAASSLPSLLIFVGFGHGHRGLLADPALRRAIHRLIGRQGLAGVGSGEKVAPAVVPLPVALGGARPRLAELQADDAAARAALAEAVEGLGPLAGERFEIVVDLSRPDDREVGEKVVAALYRLGLTAAIRALPPAELAARIARGDCDLYVGHLALPTRDPGAMWLASFAAGGDEWAARRLAELPLDDGRMRARFLERLPIVALLHRAIRVHHRADLRGVAFDPIGRLGLADLFLVAGGRAP